MALKRETDVLIIGAGPVGLFAALSLAERGLEVQIVDKDWRGSMHSYAPALHSESLRLLDGYDAVDGLQDHGHRVSGIGIYQNTERVGQLDLARLGGPFPYLLVAPQSELESALEQRLRERGIKVFWNHQALGLDQDSQSVTVKVGRMEKYSTGYPIAHTEWMISKEYTIRASFVIGADGYHSFVRKRTGINFERVGEAQTFSVFEFPSPEKLDPEALFVFRDDSVNVLWPLAEHRGRWSFEVDEPTTGAPDLERLRELIRARVPWFQSPIKELAWSTNVLFERRLVDRFGDGRIWLAGDAGHITGPVGSQSMNIGLREAHDLAEGISAISKGAASLERLSGYGAERRAEWSRLLATSGGLHAGPQAPRWAREWSDRILPCVPASGDALEELTSQVGLHVE